MLRQFSSLTLLLLSTVYCKFLFRCAGNDDYLNRLDSKCLNNVTREATWSDEGIQISSLEAIPQDQQVTICVNVYNPSKSSFIFPQGYSLISSVYMINIVMTDASLIRGIQVCLTKYQQQNRGSMQVLQASCIPTHWEANRSAPVFSFSPVEPQRIQTQRGTLTLCLDSRRCYLVVAGNVHAHNTIQCYKLSHIHPLWLASRSPKIIKIKENNVLILICDAVIII